MVYGTALSSKEPNKPSKICNVSSYCFYAKFDKCKDFFFNLIAMLKLVNLGHFYTFSFTLNLHPVQGVYNTCVHLQCTNLYIAVQPLTKILVTLN